jgi:hypothetical protein
MAIGASTLYMVGLKNVNDYFIATLPKGLSVFSNVVTWYISANPVL